MNRNRCLLFALLTTCLATGAMACNSLVGNESVSLWNVDGGGQSDGTLGETGGDTSVGVEGGDAIVDGPMADAPGSSSPEAATDAAPIGAEGGACSDVCSAGLKGCAPGGTGVQECEVQASGCTLWVTTATCAAGQTCTGTGSAASCCTSTICTQTGTACQDEQTLASCAIDANHCPYIASTSMCPTPKFCSGTAPSAACSLTCTNSCTQGQTSCVSAGLSPCTLGSNGCWAYGPPASCAARQMCSGSAGSAACTCIADPVCTTSGAACATSTSMATCARDGNGCYYETSSTPCTGGATCAAGACVCTAAGKSLCGNACADLGSDGANCRICSRSCQGGGCSGGACQAVTLASAQTPTSIAVDGSYVYWTNSDGSVDKVALGGGTPVVLSAATGTASNYVAVNASTLFWSSGISTAPVEQVILPAGSASEFNPALPYVHGLWADDAALYEFVNTGACDGSVALYRIPFNGDPYSLFDPTSVVGLALQGATVYVAGQVGCRGNFHEAVGMGSVDGGGVTELTASSVQTGPPFTNYGPLAVVNGRVYFFITLPSSTSSNLYWISSTTVSSSFTLVASTDAGVPGSLVADTSALYWPQGANIMTVSTQGGYPAVFASGMTPNGIAEDLTTIYFIDSKAGTVEKVAK